MKIFIDTSAWIAIADRNDQYNNTATQCYTDLILQNQSLITTNLVLIETFNLLTKTIGNKATVKFGNTLPSILFLKIE